MVMYLKENKDITCWVVDKCGGYLHKVYVSDGIRITCEKCKRTYIYPYKECYECWWDFPIIHVNCNGKIHAHYIDENWDSVNIDFFCDKCGEKWFDIDDALKNGYYDNKLNKR